MVHLTKFKTSLMRKIPSNLQWMLYTGTHAALLNSGFIIMRKPPPKQNEEFNEFIT